MSQTPDRRRRQGGFTLIEIMVVIVILGLLVGIVGPSAWRAVMQSEEQTCRTTMTNIKNSVDLYMLNNRGRGLPTLEDLVTEDDKGEAYLENNGEVPTDPWGTEFRIEEGETRRKFVIVSAGEDMEFGTEDDLRTDDKKNEDE